jgi:integrase/recombinase XerD
VWKNAFHPEYAETDEYKSVTSHFGRHRFSTWWRVQQDVNRELVKYMRGDKLGSDSREAIDTYLHTLFEDIEELYRENIYRLLL